MTGTDTAQDPKRILRFLNRAGFGPGPEQIRRVAARGLDAYIRDQLDAGPDPGIEKIIAGFGDQRYSVMEMSTKPTASGKQLTPNDIWHMLDHFETAKLLRAVSSSSQLYEVLVDFWYNHFNVSRSVSREPTIAYERDAIRPHVTGSFRDLLGATASHPAMLFYLDNYLNRKDTMAEGRLVRGINENYGRELMELHTLGVSAGYTQSDVTDAARVFSGWGLDHPRGELGEGTGVFVFRPEEHDTKAKRVFGLEFPAGGGREEGEKLLDYLAAHKATARFISTKLVRRFVADTPPAALVDRIAQVFETTHGDLRQVVQSLFESPEFWAADATPRFRTPFEFTVACLRLTGAIVDSAVPGLNGALEVMGMRPFFCTPPTGYSDGGIDWLSPAYLHRFRFAFALAAGHMPGVRNSLPQVVKNAGGDSSDPASIASAINREFFGGALSASTIAAVSAPHPGAGLFDRVLDVGALFTGHPLKTDPETTLGKVTGLILVSPEMQMR